MNIRSAAPTRRDTGNLPKFTSVSLTATFSSNLRTCALGGDKTNIENPTSSSTSQFMSNTPPICAVFLPVMEEENIVMLVEAFPNLGKIKLESALMTDDVLKAELLSVDILGRELSYDQLKRVPSRMGKMQVIKVGDVYALVETNSIFDGRRFRCRLTSRNKLKF
ncbi:chalcone synthase [Striga asiatica]|uniref:Chalcone synthase n=1 Tax=Striga asiatica TaxID=4170 RepID=A0A5A7RGR7_STRAF|nr:chalcone synthase [Striga asiatica]